MIYVTMTDKFMSGWGESKGKINKFVVECDNMAEAIIVENNAKEHPEMKNISIRFTKPYYNKNHYCTSLKTKNTAFAWFR